MAIDLSALQTLRGIVKRALWQGRRPPEDKMRFLEWAIDGYRKLGLHTIKENIKFVKKTPNDINVITFPNDCEQYIDLYVPVGGELWSLTRNQKIITTTTQEEAESQDSDDGEGVDIVDAQLEGFAARGGTNIHGYYNVREDQRRIYCNKLSRTEVILAYVSTGVNDTEDQFYIPKKYIPAITAYIMWQDIMYIPGQELRAREYERTFLNEEHELKILDMPNLDQIHDELLRLTYGTIRR